MPPKNKTRLSLQVPTTSSKPRNKKARREAARPSAQPGELLTDDPSFKTPEGPEGSKGIRRRYTYDRVNCIIPDKQCCPDEVDMALHDPTFGEIISNLMEKHPAYGKNNFAEVLPLARLLVEAGCREGSGLWIAFKFAGLQVCNPRARTMACCCKLETRDLIEQEAEDLNMIGWDTVRYARLCNIVC